MPVGEDHAPRENAEPKRVAAAAAAASPLRVGGDGSIDRIALLFAVVVATAVTGWSLWCCRAGIEFTDEGFYLNWIAWPWEFSASWSEFGFVYHPLYRLLGRDLVLMRQANLVITFGLAWVLCADLLRLATRPGEFAHTERRALAFVLAASTLTFLCVWLPTPSYRSLALQSLLAAAIGVVWAEGSHAPRSLAGWLLIGLAGAMAFLAKPTTAAILAVIVPLQLLVAGKMRPHLLAMAAGTAVVSLLAFAWAVDGSVSGFVARLTEGSRDLQRMQGGYAAGEILRLDRLPLSAPQIGLLFACTVVLAFAAYPARGPGTARAGLPAAFSILALLFGVTFVVRPDMPPLPSRTTLGLFFSAIPLGALLLVWPVLRNRPAGSRSARHLALPVGFLAYPYAYVFGTNGNYWQGMSEAVAFWLAGGAALIAAAIPAAALRVRNLLPPASAGLLGTCALVYLGTESPVRQSQALRQQRAPVQVGARPTLLLVTPEVAGYLDGLVATAREHGFRQGDSLIDFTGRYPAVVHALNGRAPAVAWTLGGYAGTADFVAAALARVPRDQLQRAWLLTEPGGPRAISAELLERFGIEVSRDYDQVGSFRSPAGEFRAGLTQFLLKPRVAPP